MSSTIQCNEPQGPLAAEQLHADQVEQLHAVWARLSPHVELAARVYSRHLGPEAREEFIQECRALGWKRLLQAWARRRNPLEFPGLFSRRVAWSVRRGVSIAGTTRIRCVLERARRPWRGGSERKTSAAQVDVKNHFHAIEESPGVEAVECEALREHARATPADHAAFRVDFERWFWAQPRRHRDAMRLLASGELAGEVADSLGIHRNEMSWWRKLWRDKWSRFQGG